MKTKLFASACMKSMISVLFILIIISIKGRAQNSGDQLFASDTPLKIGLHIAIRDVADTKKDSVYILRKLFYTTANGLNDSIDVSLKSRGNFRLQECHFPPLWLKFDKKIIKGTVFQGNKKLKLVLPCRSDNVGNQLIVKEYLCYKIYEQISGFAFRTRLVNVDFTEIRGKKEKHFQLKGILIEDVEKLADRLSAKTREESRIHAMALEDTNALRFSFFQLMIANTDLSSAYQHNTKLIQAKDGRFYSLPYDFDMSGLVDAPYAVVSQVGGNDLGIDDVKQRLYRGWCRPNETTSFVRREFVAKKDLLLSRINLVKDELPEKEIKSIRQYLEGFFEIMESDGLFDRYVLSACRSAK